jgi:prepilin-type N-terminal cleavage/methylation domain-containing protein/prepilin-type processing-associated H-X9-DG protein
MRRRLGFTLIEILVVVAIIALLVSILLPSLTKARDHARSAVCLGNLHRLGHALVFYTDAYRALPPFRLNNVHDGSSWVPYVNRYGRQAPRWQWFFDYGLGPVISPDGVASGSDDMTNDYFLCPSVKGEFERNIRNGAYGYNYQYLGNSREDPAGTTWRNWPVRIDRLKQLGRTVAVADSRGADLPHGKHSYSLDPPRLATEVNADKHGPKAGSDGEYGHSPVEMRHSTRGNVLFVDGHADPMRLGALGYALDDRGIVVADGSGASNHLWTGKGMDPEPIP